MSDDDVDITGTPGLRQFYQNAIDEYGTADSALPGVLINGGLAGIGLVIWYSFGGWVAAVGLVWALLNVAGIVKWGLE